MTNDKLVKRKEIGDAGVDGSLTESVERRKGP